MKKEMNRSHIDTLKNLMQSQVELLKDFGVEEERLAGIIKQGSWINVQEHLILLHRKADKIIMLSVNFEDILNKMKADYGLTSDLTYSRLLELLPLEERASLRAMQEQQKRSFDNVKRATERLTHYFDAVSNTMNTVLDELIPQRRGRIYTSEGRVKNNQWSSGSLVRSLR